MPGIPPAATAEGLAVTAGMTPRIDGVLQHVGQVGLEVSVSEARAAAATAAGNAVSALADLVGSKDAIGQALRLTVYVNAVVGFAQHSVVADRGPPPG